MPVIDEFHKALDGFTHQAACRRKYVLVGSLKTWLRARPHGHETRAGLLLRAAYARANSRFQSTIEQNLDSESCYLLVFSLLLELDCGHLIGKFIRKELNDDQLPRTSLSRQEVERLLEHVPNGHETAKRFEEKRWRFCPAVFELNMSTHFDKNRILPLHQREEINSKGGTARLWNLLIPEEFISENLRSTVPNSRTDRPVRELGIYCYEFALKTFYAGSGDKYENEKRSFYGLRDHTRMITYLGDFAYDFIYRLPQPSESASQSPTPGTNSPEGNSKAHKTTNNILLEYGEADLEEYFLQKLPPCIPRDIISFWKGLGEVAEEVYLLQSHVKDPSGDECYYGWHADIKVDNILLVGSKFLVGGKFKLADPGFAHFRKKEDCSTPPTARIGGGISYGAPERDRDPDGEFQQTIDTWSLGTVFSLAATWLVLGFQGILQFAYLRGLAIKALHAAQEHQSRKLPSHLDAFHDGNTILPIVQDWHRLLRSLSRRSDPITGKILDLVDHEMLLADPSKRISSQNLCAELGNIITWAEEEIRRQESIPVAIVNGLYEMAEEKPSARQAREVAFHKLAAALVTLRGDENDEEPEMPPHVTGLVATTSQPRNAKVAKKLMRIANESRVNPEQFDGRADRYVQMAGQPPPRAPPEIYPLSTPPARPMGPSKQRTWAAEPSPSLTNGQHPPPTPTSRFTMYSDNSPVQADWGRRLNVWQAQKELKRKGKNWNPLRRPKPNKILSGPFKNRDLIFLVDNGQSMIEHWPEAEQLMDVLMKMAKKVDDNGVDFYVTDQTVTKVNTNDAAKIRKAMSDALPESTAMDTDMSAALGRIFNDRLDKLQQAKQHGLTKRMMTLVVLTDGAWRGTLEEEAVDDKIAAFVKQSIEIFGKLVERPCTIQFIQFGDDVRGGARLRRLDVDLPKKRQIPDVVDRESSRGDVNKMLLGSILPGMDKRDENRDSLEDTSNTSSRSGDEAGETSSGMASPTGFTSQYSFAHMHGGESSPPPGTFTAQAPTRSSTTASEVTVRPLGHRKRDSFNALGIFGRNGRPR